MTSINEAVNKAAADMPALEDDAPLFDYESSENSENAETGGEGEAPVVKKAEGVEDTSTKYNDDLTAEEIIQARQVFRALKDPAQRAEVTEYLAKQAGFSKPPETKVEVKEQKKAITEYLKESMGEEFAFMVDKIGPGIEKYLNDELKQVNDLRKETQSIRDEQAKFERERLQVETDAVMEDLGSLYYKDGKIPANVSEEMSKVMDRYSPTKNESAEEYLKTVFNLANARLGVTAKPVDRESQARIQRNSRNVISKLNGVPKPNEDTARVIPGKNGKLPSLKEVVEAAAAEVESKMK